MKLIIFGGTYEGRELAEWAAGNGFSVILCVATGYGEAVCRANTDLTIKKGRMDSDEMSALFEQEHPQMVVDATHPHAALVSENIRAAAESAGVSLIRVVRACARPAFGGEYADWESGSVFYVSSAAEAVEYLKRDDDPILLTTGSKELSEFSTLPGFADRVYVRVLPQSDIVAACEDKGLSGKHIIAMQGPFSAEFNLALINTVGARWLVTKESGVSGGFSEKMEAAAESGIKVIVIVRPVKEDGLSLDETKAELLKLKKEETFEPVTVTLMGLGMGGGSQLTLEALDALRKADVIFGAERMLTDIRPFTGDTPLVPFYKYDDIVSYLNAHPEMMKACVVFSGDTGFYSGCAEFAKKVNTLKDQSAEREKHPPAVNIKILPGISSFSCLCARFGLKEEEFTPASAHGRSADVVSLLKRFGKVFLILDTQTTVGAACSALTLAGYGKTRVYAGIRLGYPDEVLLCGNAEDLTPQDNDALAVMAFERQET